MSPPRRPGTPGSPALPLLAAAGAAGPGGRRGLLPYGLLLLGAFLIVNLFSSGGRHGGSSVGGGGSSWGNGSIPANPDDEMLLSLGQEPSVSVGCDCSGA